MPHAPLNGAVIPTLVVEGKPYVLLPQTEYQRLLAKAGEMSSLPEPFADGTYPARETMAALIGQDIFRQRVTLGLSQLDLARTSRIPAETLRRIEEGRESAPTPLIDKIDRALRRAEREQVARMDQNTKANTRKRPKAKS